MQNERLENIERKLDRLTWLVAALIVLVVGLVIPELLAAAMVIGLVMLAVFFVVALTGLFFPAVSFNFSLLRKKFTDSRSEEK